MFMIYGDNCFILENTLCEGDSCKLLYEMKYVYLFAVLNCFNICIFKSVMQHYSAFQSFKWSVRGL